jgi:putative hydrolase of the HAD superfamily
VIQALFFDAAGTLIEPAEPVAKIYSRLLSPHLGTLDPAEIAASFPTAFRNVGLPKYEESPDGDLAEREWWRIVVEATIGRPITTEVFDEVFEHYANPEAWRLFPEVGDVLRQAHERNLRIAVVSNFDLRLHRILDGFGLKFEQVMTSAEARARKPATSIFSQTLQLMKLEPDQVLHVGDSENADLNGAKNAGIDAYLLKRPNTDLSDFMNWVMKHPEIA